MNRQWESMLPVRITEGSPTPTAGDQWPSASGTDPANFVIQVQLDRPLPAPWSGRLLEVFYRTRAEAIVRCYPQPQKDRAIVLAETACSAGMDFAPPAHSW
jgi:hypothetical protein